ncbi:uncharacterized protein J4E84_009964 [Alternaria hordeiaustralica]|uniref:uncharacterized protein n=1 Tax=Alternaria hordeiaustralica TaxID=1187925 RepID=UPI0020C1F4D3|nr:uncharacterized protein J4E84_009964 [Alternaria hordeiaustralica]KAI4675811.1 hypothetical protein J4E84_009964 [Alternaria hordeiaustralica]
MPVFDLGRLGRFQISYLPPSDIPQGEHQDVPSVPPPEYTDIAESEIKYTSPSQAQPPECKTEQIRRFLIEIVAITFNADFDSLNAALYNIPVPDNTNTILCDSERADLVAQSDLVRKVMFCMRSLFHIIKDIAPNDKVHDVLMEAWDTCRRRGGWEMKTLLGDSKMCWPLRKGYHHMGDALRDMPLLGPWVVVGESNEAHWISSATSKYSISPFVRTMGAVSANGM